MRALIDSKKIRILFYFFFIFFLSTINFFKIETNKTQSIFLVNNIEILGTKKINKKELLQNLKLFYDQNILLIRKNDIQKIIEKYELVKEFNIKKVYPDKLKIEIYESEIVGFVIKNKKKYFLTDHKKLLLTNDFNSITGTLPFIYGQNTEKYFSTFYNILNKKNFNLKLIKNYYFFESKRWDIELKNGLIIKFPIYELEKAIEISQELIKNKNFNTLSVIDLRIKGKVITKS